MHSTNSSRFGKNVLAGIALGSLLWGSAMAATLSASQVGNVSTENRSVPIYLTVNWYSGEQNVGLVQFDLSAYMGQSISNASVSLYHELNVVNGAQFGLFQNTSAWNSNISQWSDAPSYNAAPVAAITITDSQVGLWRNFDVTSAVNSWTNGSQANYGFTLKRLDQANPVAFFSAGVSDGDFKPQLSVTAVPEPETYAMLLAGIGLIGGLACRRKVQ